MPVWAETASPTTWHPEHVSERYGLFMIIVLGESVLAASLAIQSVASAGLTSELIAIIVGGHLILFSMWWVYFDRPDERLLSSTRTAVFWGYMHLPIFAAVAAGGPVWPWQLRVQQGIVSSGRRRVAPQSRCRWPSTS